VVERLHRGDGEAGRQEQEQAILQRPHGQQRLHFAVNIQERRPASLPRRQRLDVVTQHGVQERRPITPADLQHPGVAAVDQAHGLADGRVLGGRIPVLQRQLDPAG
jgi:hypothetical protein